MGAGRSGSTILGVTLGNCAEVFYAGELNLWLGRGCTSPLPGAERASFWARVRERVEVTPDLLDGAARSLEQSTALFCVTGRPARHRLRGSYRRVAEELYRAVARVAGATHVVDSSHFPRRARELQKLEGIDLHILFLVRDARNIVASYSGDDRVFPRFNALNTNAYLWLTYLLSLFVFLRHPSDRRMLVRYEQFISDPEGVLRDILDHVGSSAAIPDLTALDTGVAFQGNRILRSDVLALERRPVQRRRGSRITVLLDLPWRAVFASLRPAANAATGSVSELPEGRPGR